MTGDLTVSKLATLWPEIAMGIGACVCLALGLAPALSARRLTAPVAAATLIVAGVLVSVMSPDRMTTMSGISGYVKMVVVLIGLLLLLVAATVPERLRMTRAMEIEAGEGKSFEPGNAIRGEFYAFFLFSLTGVMLCAGANDLVWLFLSLELTSLPTYVMVATTRDRVDAQEAAVKYFFLGAMAAAVFLYGFALIYGATGTTVFFPPEGHANIPTIAGFMDAVRAGEQPFPPLLLTGIVLSLIGISFKIAAVPMHFYAADVYQGAATPVTAFLAFVPKTAGFVSMILLLAMVRPMPPAMAVPLTWLLWTMAALTMTVGNVLGLLQTNVKRVLAYSSIAHSGYLLVGLVASLSATSEQGPGHGTAAVLYYLVAYGLATVAAFAVLGSLEARGEEAQTYEDIAGLATRYRMLAAILLLSILSLIGLPPMVGFLGKIYLFGSAVENHLGLVIIAVLNSAIAAVYYLRIIGSCYFGEQAEQTRLAAAPVRSLGAAIAALGALFLGIAGGGLVNAARNAVPKMTGQVTDMSNVDRFSQASEE